MISLQVQNGANQSTRVTVVWKPSSFPESNATAVAIAGSLYDTIICDGRNINPFRAQWIRLRYVFAACEWCCKVVRFDDLAVRCFLMFIFSTHYLISASLPSKYVILYVLRCQEMMNAFSSLWCSLCVGPL